jgi:uncharacterized protein (TIGR02646 family)
MKRLQRLPLTPRSLGFLHDRARQVSSAADPKAEANRLWGLQDNRAFQEIREVLSRMASGIERCMYCEDSAGTDIEHFWPKAAYPDRAFEWLNYLIACSRCNSNFKRDQFPLGPAGAPLLLNPTEDDPLDHLSFSPSTGRFESRSLKGEPSIEVFGLNRAVLTRGRTNAWRALRHLLVRYAALRARGDSAEAAEVESTVRQHPFAGVLAALIRMAEGPNADLLIGPECLQVFAEYPEIRTWA